MTDRLDDEILQEIGFASDEELRAFLDKLNRLFESLNETESRVLRATLPSFSDAVQTFNISITESQLRSFLRQREPAGEGFIGALNGTHRRRHREDEE